MELDYLLNARQKSLAADARSIEFRRLYHELRRADRLQQALISARTSGTIDNLVPASSHTARQNSNPIQLIDPTPPSGS